MRRRISNIINIVIATLLLVLFLMNMYQMFTQLQEQAKEAGVSELQSVSYELERTISEASSLTMEIAIKAREVLDDRDELIDYLIKQKAEIIKTDTGAFNVYAAGSDWFFIPDFAAPEDYVAQDRTWYKGAVRSGGSNHSIALRRELSCVGSGRFERVNEGIVEPDRVEINILLLFPVRINKSS